MQPSVFEVRFYLLLKMEWQLIAFVQRLEETKEAEKLVALFKVFLEVLDCLQHTNEASKNAGENSDSQKHAKSHIKPL